MGLSERDAAAISTAIRILNEAGYDVVQVGKGTKVQAGIEFRLELRAKTRYKKFGLQAEAVKDAAIKAPEFPPGEEVEGDET